MSRNSKALCARQGLSAVRAACLKLLQLLACLQCLRSVSASCSDTSSSALLHLQPSRSCPAAPSIQQKKKRRPSVALTDLASLTASLNETAAGLEGAAARRQFGKSVGTLKVGR